MRALLYQVCPVKWAACKVLQPLWRGCILSPLGALNLVDTPVPSLPGEDWVRVRTLLGGICGTDLAILAQKQPPNSILQAFSSQPMILGHENVAIVEEAGPAVDKAWVGARVCVEPTLSCVPRGIEPLCHCCRQGQFGACENFAAAGAGKYKLPAGTSVGYNARTGGSFGESFVAHVSQLVRVDDAISDELAVLTDPLACSLHAVLAADLSQARQVLVYGGGVLGLGIVACLRATGFRGRVDVIARHSYQAQAARRLGAGEIVLSGASQAGERFEEIARRTGGTVHRVRLGNFMLSGGYDAVLDCVGSRQSINESLKWTAARGQFVMVGTGHGGNVDLTPVWFRELRVLGAYGRQIEDFQGRRIGAYQLVHELMISGKLDVRFLLAHTFGLDQYRAAISAALWKGPSQGIKIAFDFR